MGQHRLFNFQSNFLEQYLIKLCWAWGDSVGTTSIPLSKSKSGSSAVNLIRESNLVSRSGEMLQRNLYCNVLSAATANFEKGMGGENWLSMAGAAAWNGDYTNATGAGVGNVPFQPYGSFTYPIYNCNDIQYFSVPLSRLLSFFGESTPIPPVLLSGAKLSLAFDNFVNSMVFYTCAPVSPAVFPIDGSPPTGVFTPYSGSTSDFNVTVSNMQAMLDCMTIYDSSQALINASASSLQSSGIQYCYYNTYQTRTTFNNSSYTMDIMLSAAKLKSLIAVFRNAKTPAPNVDNMARLPLVKYGVGGLGQSIFKGTKATNGLLGDGGSVRLRIGSDLLTLLPISNAGQLYQQTIMSLCDTHNGFDSGVDAMHNKNKPVDVGISYYDWLNGATMAWDLEKSANLSISGMQSNNSRAIQLEITGLNAGTGDGEQIVLDVFVEFLSCANCTVENCVVDK